MIESDDKSIIDITDTVESDLPSVLEIYNDVILTSTAVYTEKPVDLQNRLAWWRARTSQGFPILVARRDHEILGFASFGEFRSWPCYAGTVEHSVHVHAQHRGKGIGTRLVLALLARAETLNKHVMVGGIDAENVASLRLHRKLGFANAGHFHEVGYKFGRWLDLIFLERLLIHDAPRPLSPSAHVSTVRKEPNSF
jgi:phosphinothricin acetyltransferase